MVVLATAATASGVIATTTATVSVSGIVTTAAEKQSEQSAATAVVTASGVVATTAATVVTASGVVAATAATVVAASGIVAATTTAVITLILTVITHLYFVLLSVSMANLHLPIFHYMKLNRAVLREAESGKGLFAGFSFLFLLFFITPITKQPIIT